MRNGDFIPTRLQAQQDAVHVVCQSKTRSNPENNVGLLTLAKYVSTVDMLISLQLIKALSVTANLAPTRGRMLLTGRFSGIYSKIYVFSSVTVHYTMEN